MDPTRTSASSALWAHLLRKDTPSNTPSDVATPPIAPLDRTGTSMRMLLHDTQANFEKFSGRIDLVTSTIEATKHEIATVKTLFDEQNEKLSMEIIDLVNRTQREIQKSVASPAQASDLETLRKDLSFTDERIQGIDKRLDAIHLLYQCNNQSLQVIQEQQQSILSSILPLLPILQTLPLRIDAAKDQLAATLTQHIVQAPPPCSPQCDSLASASINESSPTAIHTHSSNSLSPGTGRKRLRSLSASSGPLIKDSRPLSTSGTYIHPDFKKARIELGSALRQEALPERTGNSAIGEISTRGDPSTLAITRIPGSQVVPGANSHTAEPTKSMVPLSNPVPRLQTKITSSFTSNKTLTSSLHLTKQTNTRRPLANLCLTSVLSNNSSDNMLQSQIAVAESVARNGHSRASPRPGRPHQEEKISPVSGRLKPVPPPCPPAGESSLHSTSGFVSKSRNLAASSPTVNSSLPPTSGSNSKQNHASRMQSNIPRARRISPSKSAFVTPARPTRRSARKTDLYQPSPRSSTVTPSTHRPMTRSATLRLAASGHFATGSHTAQLPSSRLPQALDGIVAPSLRERKRSFVKEGKRFIPLDDDDEDDDDNDDNHEDEDY